VRDFLREGDVLMVMDRPAGPQHRGSSTDATQVRAMKAQGLGASEIAKALKISRAPTAGTTAQSVWVALRPSHDNGREPTRLDALDWDRSIRLRCSALNEHVIAAHGIATYAFV
jgi:hypothetical protein